MLRSLRSRVFAGVFVGMTLFLAANGVWIYWSLEQRLYEDLDRSLVATVQSSAKAIEHEVRPRRGPGGGPPLPPAVLRQQASDPSEGTDHWFQCWNLHGETLAKSKRLEAEDLPSLDPKMHEVRFETGTLQDGTVCRFVTMRFLPPFQPSALQLPRHLFPERVKEEYVDLRPPRFSPPERRMDEDGNVVQERPPRPEGDRQRPQGDRLRPQGERPRPQGDRQRPFGDRPRPGLLITVARDATGLQATMASMQGLLFLTWLTASLGCALILWVVLRRGLRPLAELGVQVDEMNEERLEQRLQVEPAPTELLPIITKLNDMLQRVGDAFRREQSFTSDAAHELRTPIAGLRSTLEVALRRRRSEEDYQSAARQCLEITEQMQGTVECLLDLARPPQEGEAALCVEVELAPLLHESWAEQEERARLRGLSLNTQVYGSWHTNRTLFKRIVDNLLENAVNYADRDGAIRVMSRETERDWILEVSNPASDLPEGAAKRAFEPFWRADAARREVGRHAGLGLPLCRRISLWLGGEIEARYEDGQFLIRLTLSKRSRLDSAA